VLCRLRDSKMPNSAQGPAPLGLGSYALLKLGVSGPFLCLSGCGVRGERKLFSTGFNFEPDKIRVGVSSVAVVASTA
jgi:hypothetical protein